MRKIILIAAILFTSLVSAQRIGADVIKFSGKVTTAVRDSFVVPAGETWLIFNTTTTQFEQGNSSGWTPFGGSGGGSVISVNGKAGEVILNPDDLSDASSSNKFITASLLAKLETIETGAQVNVQSDWNATSGAAWILNKPILGALAQKDNISTSDILGEGINGQVLTTNGAGEVVWANKGASSFGDLDGDPYDNTNLQSALNSKANDSEVIKINPNSLVTPLTLAVSDSTTIASGIFTINDVVIDTTTRTPGGDNYVTGGTLSGAGVLTLNMNYGSPIQIPGFNSGSGGTVSWGGIGGTIADQTDMMGLFNGKANVSHNHNASAINAGILSLDRIPEITNQKLGNGSVSLNKIENKPYGLMGWTDSNVPYQFAMSSVFQNIISNSTVPIINNPTSDHLIPIREFAIPSNISFAKISDILSVSGSGYMLKSENLSGLTDYATARTNLGLGSVNNTSDANKPISTAAQTALNGKANTSHAHTASNITDFNAAVTAALITTGSGSTGLSLYGSTTGVYTFSSGIWNWIKIGKLVYFRLNISGITGVSTGNFVIDPTSTTMPAIKNSVGLFNAAVGNLKDLDYQQIQATAIITSKIGLIIKPITGSTSNAHPLVNADFTAVNPGIIEITGIYETN